MGNMLDTLVLGLIGAAKEASQSASYRDKDEDDYQAADYAVKYGAKAYDALAKNAEEVKKRNS